MADSRFYEDDEEDMEELLQMQEVIHQLYMMEEEDEDELVMIAVAALALVDQMARDTRNAQRSQRRQGLLRSDLIDNPRAETPWQVLYRAQNPPSFITTMGFDPITFQRILDAGFNHLWESTTIARTGTNVNGIPRPTRRSLDGAGGLGLLLHYLNSTMNEISLCEIFALIPSSVNRYLTFSLPILVKTLRHMPDARVVFPKGDEFDHLNQLILQRHPLLVGAFGSMDGLNLPVQTAADEDLENATYNGWLHSHFVSCVYAFAADGTIIACSLNAPGSWHDSRIAKPIYKKLINDTPAGYYLVTDTAFPRGAGLLEGKIQSPLKQKEKLPDDEEERNNLLSFNRQLLSYRQTAEWGMRALQGSFSRLRIPLPINHQECRSWILEAITRLHNLRTRAIGINQIRSVYMPMWNDDEDFLLTFQNMAFSALRKNDRVTQFHVEAVRM